MKPADSSNGHSAARSFPSGRSWIDGRNTKSTSGCASKRFATCPNVSLMGRQVSAVRRRIPDSKIGLVLGPGSTTRNPRLRRKVAHNGNLWRAAGPVRFVTRRLNTSGIRPRDLPPTLPPPRSSRPRRASRPGLLAPQGLGPPFNTSLLAGWSILPCVLQTASSAPANGSKTCQDLPRRAPRTRSRSRCYGLLRSGKVLQHSENRLDSTMD
jgi:hypothetical protein